MSSRGEKDHVNHPGQAARAPRATGMSSLYQLPRKPYVYRGNPPPLPSYAELRARADAAIAAIRAGKEADRDADDG